MANFVKVAAVGDVPPGTGKCVEAGGKQIAAVFPRAWVGRKYSIKTGVALRAFLRVVPDVLKTIRDGGGDPLDAHAIRQTIKPWGLLVGDARFETEGEWRQKQAGGTRGTVELLARELQTALRG